MSTPALPGTPTETSIGGFPTATLPLITVAVAAGNTTMPLLQRERVQHIARADDDVLAAVEEEGLRAVARVGAERGVPERLAGQRIVCDKVAATIISEQQPTRGTEQSHRPTLTPGRRHG